MANVIEIIIRAKDQTTAAISSATKQMEALNVAGKVSAVQFAVIGAAVAASVGTFTALAGAATSAAERLDRLNAISQQTGVAASTLSQLEFAASQTNASIEGLNTGLRFLARNLYEARSGGEEQAKTLRALGFSAEEVAKGLGGTEQAFFKISERLSQIQDPGTRAALALKLLGRGASELIPLLSQGEDGIRAYMAESDRLGITVSKTAAILGDEFGDAVNLSKLQIEGLKASIAEALLPSLIQAVTATQGMLAEIIRFTKENQALVVTVFKVSGAFSALAIGIGAIVGAVALAKAAIAGLGLSIGGLAVAGGPIALAIIGLAALAGAIVYAQEKAKDELRFRVGLEGADAVAAELQRLIALRDKYREEAKAAPVLSSVEKIATAAVSIPFSKQQNDALKGISREASAASEKVAELDRTIDAATKAAADSSFMSKGVPFKPVADGAKAAIDPVKALLAEIEKASRVDIDFKAALEPLDLTKLRGVKPPERINDEFEPIEAQRVFNPEDVATGEAIADVAGQIGVSFETLQDALIAANTELDTLAGTTIAFSLAIQESFAVAFDPLRNGIAAVQDAVFTFADTVDSEIGGAFNRMIFEAQSFGEAFDGVLKAIGKAIAQLVLQLIAAIAKAAVLKFLGFGFLSGGGTIIDSGSSPVPRLASTGGTVPALASGGSIRGVAHLAAGGAIMRAPVVHASQGVRVVPGAAQAFDSVPAMLAPGEVVLPTIGGRMPGDLLAGLAQLGKDLGMVLARSFVPPGPQMAMAGNTYNIQTLDAASFRTHARRGEFSREMALASDPARD